MKWLNLETATLRTPEFIGSSPVERATWLCVLAYCVELENGGVIVGAAHWKTRQWQQACGVTRAEIDKAPKLLEWIGDDLKIWNYPIANEIQRKAKREIAILNGAKGGRPPKNKTDEKPTLVSSEEPTSETEREEKGKIREENTPIVPAPSETTPPEEPPASPPVAGKNLPTTQTAIRIGEIFHRKRTTPWSPKEVAAFKSIGPIDDEDLAIVEEYYSKQWPPNRNLNTLRHDMQTFLNNFRGEVDRAKASRNAPASANGAPTVKRIRSAAEAYGEQA